MVARERYCCPFYIRIIGSEWLSFMARGSFPGECYRAAMDV